MKLLIVFALVAVAAARAQDLYDDAKFDKINVDEIIGNKRLLKTYAHCFIGDGPCTPEGKDINELIPDAVKTSCAKCSEKQKTLVSKSIKGIEKELPEEYAALTKLHDPENKRLDELKAFLAKYSA